MSPVIPRPVGPTTDWNGSLTTTASLPRNRTQVRPYQVSSIHPILTQRPASALHADGPVGGFGSAAQLRAVQIRTFPVALTPARSGRSQDRRASPRASQVATLEVSSHEEIRAVFLSVAVLGLSAAVAIAASPVGTRGAHGETIPRLPRPTSRVAQRTARPSRPPPRHLARPCPLPRSCKGAEKSAAGKAQGQAAAAAGKAKGEAASAAGKARGRGCSGRRQGKGSGGLVRRERDGSGGPGCRSSRS